MPHRDPLTVVDTPTDGSVSFAPLDPVGIARVVAGGGGSLVPVGPGRAAFGAPELVGGASRDGVTGYPIQPGKVQAPPLRHETLARHRLLDWLDVKVHNRVVFVVADAGYGKTTLLADFTTRTRLRTLWYRMDDEDRSWVAFLSYLVAAGRVHDPEFASRTFALLADTGPGGATLDDVLAAFMRELPSIAPDGAVVIFDDFHVAEDVPDVVRVARELVTRAPERLTLVFSSRRMPPIPVARLRALGEVAELRTTDLRFSHEETEALFKDTYGRALEPDVVDDLSKRTDGWAASLYLVRTALRDKSPGETRSFVRALSGAQGDLHDYLAEEVIGDLSTEHQAFLMRTALLHTADPRLVSVASDLPQADVERLIAKSERLGLLSRRRSATGIAHGFHPLVRDFLIARLVREVGGSQVAAIHRRIARSAQEHDWRAAIHHFAEAGDASEIHRTLEASIEQIVGSGEVGLAAKYLEEHDPGRDAAAFQIIRSRIAGRAMDVEAAMAHARRAVALEPGSSIALGNLLSMHFLAGDHRETLELAAKVAEVATSPIQRLVASASIAIIRASDSGELTETIRVLDEVAVESRRMALQHFEAIALLNSAMAMRAQGRAPDVLARASEAYEVLGRNPGGSEPVAALLAKAWAVAHLGDLNTARTLCAESLELCTAASRIEWATESAEIEVSYGSEERAQTLLSDATSMEWNPGFAGLNTLTRVQLALRRGQLDEAMRWLPNVPPSVPSVESGYLARYLALSAHVAVSAGLAETATRLEVALDFAEKQHAWHWYDYSRAVAAVSREHADVELGRIAEDSPVYLSMVAELVVERLAAVAPATFERIAEETERRPDRWRPTLRRLLAAGDHPSRQPAARLLDLVGERSDVGLLRAIARSTKGSRGDAGLGRNLARRLASRVFVEDLGRVVLRIGDHEVAAPAIRRKVLAMLVFLLTKSRFSAARDEVIDALWPELAPDVAVNSLNQTVYFLRRVFEPEYHDTTTAGYVGHDSDVLWLDPDLIGSRSQRCRDLIDQMRPHATPGDVELLSTAYTGRFALDFAYEDWAVPYRDSLHAAYLQVIESAVTADLESGHYQRGVRLARRALAVDPESDGLELSLLRLYRAMGAHSAAAEQYEHYSTYLREELGVDPPDLTSI